MMSYSVVIPFFNGGSELFRAIESVFLQTFPPREVFLVDDGSTNSASIEIIRVAEQQYPINLIKLNENKGVAEARNTGIEKSTSDLVAFLDSDDSWLPEKMKTQVSYMTDSNIIASGTKVFGDTRTLKGGRQLTNLSVRDLLCRHYIQTSTLVVRKSCLVEVGGFPKGRRYAEEGDLYLQLADKGKLLFINEPFVIYSNGKRLDQSDGLSCNKPAMFRGELLNILMAHKRSQINICELVGYIFLTTIRFLMRYVRKIAGVLKKDR